MCTECDWWFLPLLANRSTTTDRSRSRCKNPATNYFIIIACEKGFYRSVVKRLKTHRPLSTRTAHMLHNTSLMFSYLFPLRLFVSGQLRFQPISGQLLRVDLAVMSCMCFNMIYRLAWRASRFPHKLPKTQKRAHLLDSARH